MADLATEYLGLPLKNPFIVSSCGISGTLEGIMECVEHGAAAVVLKSLFEEQIDMESGIPSEFRGSKVVHPEARDYLQELGKAHGPDRYLKLIGDAKEQVPVPIIASINCASSRWWIDFTRQIEDAGADALELNIAFMPKDFSIQAGDLESHLFSIVKAVTEKIDLPVAVKIGPYFSALPHVVQGIIDGGAQGLVLFNRFYRFDIDTDQKIFINGDAFSSPEELHLPLRWIAMLSSRISIPVSGTTGVHSAEDAVKMILAGARVIQVASVLYKKKISYLKTLINETDAWLEANHFSAISDARGLISRSDPESLEGLNRLQYIKALTGIE